MGFADLMAAADIPVRQVLGGVSNVTYTPGVGVAVVVDGVFEAAHQHLDLGEPGVTTQGPAVFLTLTDLPSDPEADTAATVTVAGVTYTPHTARPDDLRWRTKGRTSALPSSPG
jgi:hypothetical protein